MPLILAAMRKPIVANDKTELSFQSRRSSADKLYAGDDIARRANSVWIFSNVS